MSRNRYEATKARMNDFRTDGLGQHQMTYLAPVRCWCFQRVVDNKARWCPYGFHFTWQPGVFSIFGDVGELQLVHYQAITSELKPSLEWMVDAEFDYLMSKSTAQQEYDREGTADLILQPDYIDAVASHVGSVPRCNSKLVLEEDWIRDLRAVVFDRIETEHEGGEFFRAITGDWGACQSWPRRCEFQIAAMQFAARWILDNECIKEAARCPDL